MKKRIDEYFNFIRSNGRALSEINPGSDEWALIPEKALKAIDFLKESQVPLLGGDILSIKSNKLIYAYQLWGKEYHYLNWYCERNSNESFTEFLQRSYEIAKEVIYSATKISNDLNKDIYIVLVI